MADSSSHSPRATHSPAQHESSATRPTSPLQSSAPDIEYKVRWDWAAVFDKELESLHAAAMTESNAVAASTIAKPRPPRSSPLPAKKPAKSKKRVHK